MQTHSLPVHPVMSLHRLGDPPPGPPRLGPLENLLNKLVSCQTRLVTVVLSKSCQTICIAHLMQLRNKRAKSPPTQDSIPRRRALHHSSRKEATLSSLQIQPNSAGLQFSWKIQAARQGKSVDDLVPGSFNDLIIYLGCLGP